MDWLAAVVTLIACQLIVWKRWEGFVLHIVNAALWAWLMWRANLLGFVALEIVFAAQAAWGIYTWRFRCRS